MAQIYKNNLIVLHRGDTINLPVPLNIGTLLAPEYYELQEADKVYLGIMEPNQRWEDALLRRVFTYEDWINHNKACVFNLSTEDTEYLLPGTYYYQIKLYIEHDPRFNNNESVSTLISKTKLLLVE